MTKPNVANPYLTDTTIDGSFLVRLQADVGKEDRNLVRQVCPQQGVYTFVLSSLFKRFCDELRKQGIVDFTREEDFLNAVANSTFIFPNGQQVAVPAKNKKSKAKDLVV